MIHFRASMAGGCLRKIVSYGLDPEGDPPHPDKRRFLKLGHYFQAQITEELAAHGVEVDGVEAEGVYVDEDAGFTLTGHVDGILPVSGELLEVKAVTSSMFQKLTDAADWRDVYPQYVAPAQVYGSFKCFTSEDGEWHWELEEPLKGTRFIFIDRDRGWALGGLPEAMMPEALNAYTFRPDMVLEHDPEAAAALMARHAEAARWVRKGELPQECDAEGWCFHCQTQGSRTRGKLTGNKIVLVQSQEYPDVTLIALQYDELGRDIKAREDQRKKIRKQLIEWMQATDPTAEGIDIHIAGKGRVSLRYSESVRTYPDSDTVKNLVSKGQIPLNGSSSDRLTVNYKEG